MFGSGEAQDGEFLANLYNCRLVESERATLGEEVIRGMTWATFKIKFLEKYFPIIERNDKM